MDNFDYKGYIREAKILEIQHSDVVKSVRESSPGVLFHLVDQFLLANGLDLYDPKTDKEGFSAFMSDIVNITPKDVYQMDSLTAENLMDKLSDSQLIYILIDLLENTGKIEDRSMRVLADDLADMTIDGQLLSDFLKDF